MSDTYLFDSIEFTACERPANVDRAMRSANEPAHGFYFKDAGTGHVYLAECRVYLRDREMFIFMERPTDVRCDGQVVATFAAGWWAVTLHSDPPAPGAEPDPDAPPASVHIIRTCPRCHARMDHPAALLKNETGGFRVEFTCVNCGNEWRGQYREAEWK